MLYFITYPDWDGHWHKYYNRAVCSELQRHGVRYRRITIDFRGAAGEMLERLQQIDSAPDDVWLLSMAQNPAVELIADRPGRKYGHVHGMSCFPFEPAVLYGIDLREDHRFGLYDGLFVSSRWSLDNARSHYPRHGHRFILTGFPMDFEVYDPYLTQCCRDDLVVFNQRFSCERLPLIEIELSRKLVEEGFEVWHLYAPVDGRLLTGCAQMQRTRNAAEALGVKFVANPTKEEYHRNLARASVLVTTSICDNLPVSVIEAIHLGVVPVVPDSMCFPEFVHPDNRYPPYDLQAMVDMVVSRPIRNHDINGYARQKVVSRYLKVMGLL